MPDCVFYHANCWDGFGSAFAAYLALSDKATYHPVTYGQPPPPIPYCDTLFILDFSYPRDVLADLARTAARRVIVLDHHVTAQEDLRKLADAREATVPGVSAWFDLKESGATLSWQYFHPGEPVPLLFALLRDRDLWEFALPGSKEFNAAIRSYPYDFEVWQQFLDFTVIDRLKAEGRTILSHQNQMVQTMCAKPLWIVLGGERVPCVNATCYFSECGDYLCQTYPLAKFSAYFLLRGDGKVQWGLRSRGGFDVSAVAKLFQGGGHAAASGFTSSVPWLAEVLKEGGNT